MIIVLENRLSTYLLERKSIIKTNDKLSVNLHLRKLHMYLILFIKQLLSKLRNILRGQILVKFRKLGTGVR